MRWKGNWIWTKVGEKPRNFYLCIRKTLKLNKKVRRATAFVSADSRYKFYINGKYVGRGVAKCDPKFQYYDVHNITKILRPGKNIIAAIIHHYGEETFSYLLGRGGFLCQIEMEYSDSKKEIIGTDKTWRVKQEKAWNQDAPRSTVQIGFQEIYDARKEMSGWEKLNFDDSGWDEPIVIGKPPVEPWTNLIERDIPFLAEKEILPVEVIEIGECPQAIDLNNIKDISAILDEELHLPTRGAVLHPTKVGRVPEKNKTFLSIGPCIDKSIYLVLDFGKEVSGFPRICLKGVDGGVIDFGYDEILIKNRVHPTRGGGAAGQSDRYIMKDGYQEHEQGFTWRGFRYIQLVFRNCAKPVKLYGVTLNHYCYPVSYRGAFKCSDPMLNRIWEVGRYTLQMCMHDSFEDCPWREQTQWWGDARVQGLVNYYAFGDTKLFKKGLRQIAESQLRRQDGLMQPFAPGGTHGSSIHAKMAIIPSFCLIWILSLYDYYFYTGDTEPVKKLYPNLKNLVEAFRSSLSERGLTTLEHWQFIDWAPIDAKPENTALNCFLCAGFMTAAKIARLNNDKPQAKEYEKMAAEMKDNINKYLWSEKKGLYADGIRASAEDGSNKQSEVFSQQANCLAVLFDIAPKEKQEEIMNKIQTDDKVVKITTPYFMFYFLSALLHLNRHELVKDIIRTRWGEMIGKGATTFWEDFRGVANGNGGGSLCHAWSACPTAMLSMEILGVKPLEPGFRKILIEPHLFNLNYAKGIVPTVIGDIKISWKIKDKILSFKASIPKGCTAEAVISEAGGTKKYTFKNVLSVSHYLQGGMLG
ncbi:hypothetical protein AUJ66_04495 [Candidatus Desantisbacteria bacterium CG1_02_38_46]|uniref:Uncharacterized protein n=3 Tax=unclassified Candidatus Desantisiibacteriota TaxID=3106372 RepID=A0A2H9PCL5_9BACT|nr:MAG: hypothetical protein AUJ66_04495 [Candidatus Desantisbacteria bacterium CG1_02_38_46]PIU51853.1 MAG: hypothetical protein COS91_02280 [Candidatus Desantisbacteria bacterium CG07_land_8_20_14_0_80_39_15]PIZ16108.1 MAG: hypothetical protein COY51_03490 [Candidatus Desantisbacteria bacterium CG_4_10_14_0_8_um_filter_39_17]